ncbi:MAG: hypothetical protein WCF17_08500 [Terracidiphilus sp.]
MSSAAGKKQARKQEKRANKPWRRWIQVLALAVFFVFLFLFVLGRTRGSFPWAHQHPHRVAR